MSYRGALIGCGYISQEQLAAWQMVQGAEIVAVCDLDETKARQRAAEFAIPAYYTDYQQMLQAETLDFIDIATRPPNHPQLVNAVAQLGLPILCQKPMAETMAEAAQMVAACAAAGVMLMINENGRQQAWFRQIKTLLDDGRLGTIHNARFFNRWRSTLPTPNFEGQDFFQTMPRLLVYELGVHYFDTARYLFGEADSLYAVVQQISPHIRGDDKALIITRFGELTCLIDSNWYAIEQPGNTQITWASLLIEGTSGTLHLHNNGTLALYRADGTQTWDFAADTGFQSFVATQQHFIDCLRDGREPETSGQETLKTMALVFGAYRSSDEQRIIDPRIFTN